MKNIRSRLDRLEQAQPAHGVAWYDWLFNAVPADPADVIPPQGWTREEFLAELEAALAEAEASLARPDPIEEAIARAALPNGLKILPPDAE